MDKSGTGCTYILDTYLYSKLRGIQRGDITVRAPNALEKTAKICNLWDSDNPDNN